MIDKIVSTRRFGDSQATAAASPSIVCNQSAPPAVFRLFDYSYVTTDQGKVRMSGTLFHARVSMRVIWEGASAQTDLFGGVLVAPVLFPFAHSESGHIWVANVKKLTEVDPTVDLFATIPSAWVDDRALLSRASALVMRLPTSLRRVFNSIFWTKITMLHRFLLVPGSVSGHHSTQHGNLRHTVAVAEMVLDLLPHFPTANGDVALLAALLHDVGKADEYVPRSGGWALTDRGRLVGHKLHGVTILQAALNAAGDLPQSVCMTLLNSLGTERFLPPTSGFRSPQTPEALLVSTADLASGRGDLHTRQSNPSGGWGQRHPHLGDTAPYSLPPGITLH
jgi:3'-5' exoribonuclease